MMEAGPPGATAGRVAYAAGLATLLAIPLNIFGEDPTTDGEEDPESPVVATLLFVCCWAVVGGGP